MEAVVPIMSRLGAHAAPDLDDIARRLARAAEQLDRMLAGRPADCGIVAADELGDPLGVDVAVQHNDRNFGIDRLLDNAGQSRRLLGRDEEEIDLLHHQVLAVGDLLLGLVLAVGDDEVDIGMVLCLGLDVLVELHPPRLQRGALAEADFPLGRGLGRAPSGRHMNGHCRAGHGGRQF